MMYEIEITPAMIKAGEAVLDRAFEKIDVPPYWTVCAAAQDVYIAMENVKTLSSASSTKALSMPLHKASTTSKERKGPMKTPVFVVDSDGILVDVYLKDRPTPI